MVEKNLKIEELPDELKDLRLDDLEACRIEDLKEIPLDDLELIPISDEDLRKLLIPCPAQKDLEDAP